MFLFVGHNSMVLCKPIFLEENLVSCLMCDQTHTYACSLLHKSKFCKIINSSCCYYLAPLLSETLVEELSFVLLTSAASSPKANI